MDCRSRPLTRNNSSSQLHVIQSLNHRSNPLQDTTVSHTKSSLVCQGLTAVQWTVFNVSVVIRLCYITNRTVEIPAKSTVSRQRLLCHRLLFFKFNNKLKVIKVNLWHFQCFLYIYSFWSIIMHLSVWETWCMDVAERLCSCRYWNVRCCSDHAGHCGVFSVHYQIP